MNKLFYITLLSLTLSSQAHARDKINDNEITPALDPEVIGNSVEFYFGEQSHAEIKTQMREYTTIRRANAVGKSDVEACKRAFQSALIALRDSALAEGGNAVVNIRSNYNHNTTTSETHYKCGNGLLMAAVALKGDAVVLTTDDSVSHEEVNQEKTLEEVSQEKIPKESIETP